MSLVKIKTGFADPVRQWQRWESPAALEKAILDAAETAAEGLLGALRARMGSDPRWNRLEGFTGVLRSREGVAVGISPDYPESQEAWDLEYASPPNPVLRVVVNDTHDMNSRAFEDALGYRLFGGR